MNIMEFKKELEMLINKHNIENTSNTPDFILSQYLVNCLIAFNLTCNERENWYGRNPIAEVGPTTNPTSASSEPESRGIVGRNDEIKPIKGEFSKTSSPKRSQGKTLLEYYEKTGGVPIKTRYIDEIKAREEKK